MARTLPQRMWNDPSRIDLGLDSRAVTFENPTGERGAGGQSRDGRKGAPMRIIFAGERVVLADLTGAGTVRHFWCTFPPAPPEVMRALLLEVFYDGNDRPSISVPLLDFFALPHGRPVAYTSALTSAQEGRGFNAYFPMPFRDGLRVEVVNGSAVAQFFYFQLDYTKQETIAADAGFLHATFRRENPTTMRDDFTIVDGLRGPGRFLGCAIGVRPIDGGQWYGEGEVKVYRDGDTRFPTICGTGLEDYAGSAWGMGAHAALYGGAPLDVRAPGTGGESVGGIPDFVGFYRWHVPDPIVFTDALRVTIQQIGMHVFFDGQDAEMDASLRANPPAGTGWLRNPRPGVLGFGICERVDDYCAAAFVYCRDAQPVPPVDLAAAIVDIERKPYEPALAFERGFF